METAWTLVSIISDRLSRARARRVVIGVPTDDDAEHLSTVLAPSHGHWTPRAPGGDHVRGPRHLFTKFDRLYVAIFRLVGAGQRRRLLRRLRQQAHRVRGRETTEEPCDRCDEVEGVCVWETVACLKASSIDDHVATMACPWRDTLLRAVAAARRSRSKALCEGRRPQHRCGSRGPPVVRPRPTLNSPQTASRARTARCCPGRPLSPQMRDVRSRFVACTSFASR